MRRMFPQLQGEWGGINVNDLAVKVRQLIDPLLDQPCNPFLDPDQADGWIMLAQDLMGVDYTYGGWLEDRAVLWEGHYMKPGETVHLGVDFNVEAGLEVHMPVEGILKYSFHDPDQNGGWGGKLVFEIEDGYLIFGHLKNIVADVGRKYLPGEVVGVIAEKECNGGWGPHLHVQRMRKYQPDVDGYGRFYEGIEEDFPDPMKI